MLHPRGRMCTSEESGEESSKGQHRHHPFGLCFNLILRQLHVLAVFSPCCQLRVNWSQVSSARQRDEVVNGHSGACDCRPPLQASPHLCHLCLTSAHSLLSTRQDSWRVNDADALQDLVGHLGTLKPVFVSIIS